MGRITEALERFERSYVLGVSPKVLKHHYSLIPIHILNILGLSWAAYFSWRTLYYNPDSCLTRDDNFERYRDGTYFKFFNFSGYRPASNAPIYRREGDPPDWSYALTLDGDEHGPEPDRSKFYRIFIPY